MKNYFVKILLYILLLLPNIVNSNNVLHPTTDYRLTTPQVSANGKWIIYNKESTSVIPYVTTYLKNTITKKTIQFKKGEVLINHLLNNDIVISKSNNTLNIIDLNDSLKNKKIHNVKKFDTDKHNNILYTISFDNNLRIEQLTTNELLISLENISDFYINHNRTFLVIIDDSKNNTLFKINLKTLKVEKLLNLPTQLKTLDWNPKEDQILITDENDHFTIINLKNNNIKNFSLPQKDTKIINKSFYSNNDLLITYNTITDLKYSDSEYLHIWGANSRYLVASDYSMKYHINYHAFIYKQNSDKIIYLDRNRDKEYLNIDIPNHIVYYYQLKDRDFRTILPNFTYYLKNTSSENILELKDTNGLLIPSPDRKSLLFPTKDRTKWQIYNLDSAELNEIYVDKDSKLIPHWSLDSKQLIFLNKKDLVSYDLNKKTIKKLTNLKNITDAQIDLNIPNPRANKYTIDTNKSIFLKIYQADKSAIYKLTKTKLIQLSQVNQNNKEFAKRLTNTSPINTNIVSWIEESYNFSPTIFIHMKNKVEKVTAESLITNSSNLHQRKVISFSDKNGVELKGYLYYPKDFNPQQKYPMITHIYNIFNPVTTFIHPKQNSSIGFNPSKLTTHGYFVFTPDTYVSDEGPGLAAVDCVLRAIEAVTKEETSINKSKLGLSGHSFGGYKSAFIATQTTIFSAIISANAVFDFTGSELYRYNNQILNPEYARVEGSQIQMRESYAQNPEKYIANSTILHAHKIDTPLLLVTGTKDDNAFWENTRSMYFALKRYEKPNIIALFYNQVGHVFTSSTPIQTEDFSNKYIEWFDYFLKDNKNIKWINDNTNTNSYTWIKETYR